MVASVISAYSLPAKLDRFEERYAVLQNEETGEIRWPIARMPAELQAGDDVEVSVQSKETKNNQQYENMRQLLEDLIN